MTVCTQFLSTLWMFVIFESATEFVIIMYNQKFIWLFGREGIFSRRLKGGSLSVVSGNFLVSPILFLVERVVEMNFSMVVSIFYLFEFWKSCNFHLWTQTIHNHLMLGAVVLQFSYSFASLVQMAECFLYSPHFPSSSWPVCTAPHVLDYVMYVMLLWASRCSRLW